MNNKEKVEDLAIKVIQWVGSPISLIIHTVIFGIFLVLFFFVDVQKLLLVLTTLVSLEAIYLSILIQMSVNYQAKKLNSVASDVEKIQEDVEEIQENVEEIQEEMEEDGEDVGG